MDAPPAGRVALAVEYDGGPFHGWQRQPHSPSVQRCVEEAIERIAGRGEGADPVAVHCAGRTDAGVHALAQVCHFDAPVVRPLRAWTFGLNSHLPDAVAVHWAAVVPDDFHARHSAVARSYRYTIVNRPTRPGLEHGRVAWVREPLDAERMHAAAQSLVGEHDFQSFRAAACQARHAVREVIAVSVRREGRRVILDIKANAFLHNMVRIVAGSLIAVGRGERDVGWTAELLAARDRTLGGATAPPGGLVFLQPDYPARYAIPDFTAAGHAVWRP